MKITPSMKHILALITITLSTLNLSAQSQFFRQYWLKHDQKINNNFWPNDRTRINDRRSNTTEGVTENVDTQGNGLELVSVADSIFYLERAEAYFELYGGHPGMTNRHFLINGGQKNPIPDKGTAASNSVYLCTTLPIEFRDLVTGNNAFQFICDRGNSGWGHFIVDEMAVRCYLKPNHPDLVRRKLDSFKAIPSVESKVLGDVAKFKLNFPPNFENEIVAVHYFGRYLGYDDSGNETEDTWHGFTHNRKFTNHIGTVNKAPFAVEWNTRMIPTQAKPMAVKVLVELQGGFFYWTDVLEGLSFPFNRPRVQLYSSHDLPKPFWSRDNQVKVAHIELPVDISAIESLELHTRIWDGGRGTTNDPFTLNGHPYAVTTGLVPHDIFYYVNLVDVKHLVSGMNELKMLCASKHHGLEIPLPGPCLIVRYKK